MAVLVLEMQFATTQLDRTFVLAQMDSTITVYWDVKVKKLQFLGLLIFFHCM